VRHFLGPPSFPCCVYRSELVRLIITVFYPDLVSHLPDKVMINIFVHRGALIYCKNIFIMPPTTSCQTLKQSHGEINNCPWFILTVSSLSGHEHLFLANLQQNHLKSTKGMNWSISDTRQEIKRTGANKVYLAKFNGILRNIYSWIFKAIYKR